VEEDKGSHLGSKAEEPPQLRVLSYPLGCRDDDSVTDVACRHLGEGDPGCS
jgi:hypothetical protein